MNNAAYQIPRYSLIWMLIALTSVVLPHSPRLPVWLIIVSVFCIVVRVLIFQGRLRYPGKKIKTLIVFSVLTAVFFEYGRNFLATDTMVAVLIVGIALKLLEMNKQRDVLIVIMLTYFTTMSEFIYSQAIGTALYMFCAVLLNTCALMSLHQTQSYQRPMRTFKLTALILGQCIPLMMVLFVFFPRMAPLWSMPSPDSSAKSGLSDTMAPGDIGKLIRNADVVFKVQFDGPMPENDQLYWRGLTFDLFNGRAWSKRPSRFSRENQNLNVQVQERRGWYQDIEWQGDSITYNIIMEPSNQNWIFALKMPQISQNGMYMNRHYQVESRIPVSQRFSYDVTSWPEHSLGENLDEELRRRSLLLPDEGNSRSVEFAKELYARSSSETDFIDSLLTYYNEEEFYYTLEPSLLGENTVDEFLFDSREGFCEHFASSFTFLMRAAGIPARVVTGYQGGERNPYDGTLIVHQYDAHAWAEVWIDGEGWMKVDPTASVAPERIILGSQFAYQDEGSFLEDAGFAGFFMRRSQGWNKLRLYVETIDYAWVRFVLNYDQRTQFTFFSNLFGTASQLKVLMFATLSILGSLAFLTWIILRPKNIKNVSPATRYYLRFCSSIESKGYGRRCGETPVKFCERVSAINPAWSASIKQITLLFNELTYSPGDHLGSDEKAKRVTLLRKAVRRFQML